MRVTLSALEAKVPPPLLLLSLATLVWVLPGEIALPGWVNWFGWLLVLCGLALNFLPKLQFRRVGTTVSPVRPASTSVLVTSGIYRLSRNPMYLGYAVALSGWALVTGKPVGLAAVAFFVGYITRFQIVPEERHLSARFPGAYAAYCRGTRRWA